MNRLVFVAGALRSGSTMLHLILDGHPNIDNLGEYDFLFDLVGDNGELPNKDDFLEWLSLDRVFQSQNLKIDESLSVNELIRSFVLQKQKDSIVLTLNIHRNFHRIPFLFPEADYIHLIRDPRDVARSSIGMGWAGNVYYGIDHWVETENSWQSLLPNLKKHNNIEVKYENLVLNPEEELTKVCQFLQLPYSSTMLTYNDSSTYSKPDIALIEQWRNKQTINEIKQVESKAESLMNKLGYTLSDGKLKPPSFLHRGMLKFDNFRYKNLFLIKRYGIYLYLIQKISRKLGCRRFYSIAQLRCNEIDKGYLK